MILFAVAHLALVLLLVNAHFGQVNDAHEDKPSALGDVQTCKALEETRRSKAGRGLLQKKTLHRQVALATVFGSRDHDAVGDSECVNFCASRTELAKGLACSNIPNWNKRKCKDAYFRQGDSDVIPCRRKNGKCVSDSKKMLSCPLQVCSGHAADSIVFTCANCSSRRQIPAELCASVNNAFCEKSFYRPVNEPGKVVPCMWTGSECRPEPKHATTCSEDMCPTHENLSPLIEFGGTEDGEYNQTWKGAYHGIASYIFTERQVLKRPTWQKTLRCRGRDLASCEECSSAVNCWRNVDGWMLRGLDVTATSNDWARFRTILHIRCGAPKLKLFLSVNSISNGSFRVFWDNVEVISPNFEINLASSKLPITEASLEPPDNMAHLYADIPIAVPGGHELVLDFMVDTMSATSFAEKTSQASLERESELLSLNQSVFQMRRRVECSCDGCLQNGQCRDKASFPSANAAACFYDGGIWCEEEASYVVGTAGTNACPTGYKGVLDSYSACQVAAGALGYSAGSEDGYADPATPKGCHIALEAFWFNTHPSGASRRGSSPVCIKESVCDICWRALDNDCEHFKDDCSEVCAEGGTKPDAHGHHLLKNCGVVAGVEVQGITVSMPAVFAACEDLKVCLNVLALDLTLRNTNAKQWECLHDAKPSGVCDEWRKCLNQKSDGVNHTAHLIKMLEAAGIGDATPALLSTRASGEKVSEDSCFDPLLEDPESWDCDCYGSMEIRCHEIAVEIGVEESDAFQVRCIRTHMCHHRGVCSAWKDQQCGNLETLKDAKMHAMIYEQLGLLTAGNSVSTKLFERSAVKTTRQHVDQLEGTTSSKSCA